jgi:hypothetical protein
MDIFFADPSEVPLPPAEVRIRTLSVEPWPDGKRLRVTLEVDPFQKRPNVDLTLFDNQGRELSSAFIIESMTRKMELVMHLRLPASGPCTLQAVLYFASLPDPAPRDVSLGLPAAGTADPGPDVGQIEIPRQVVDSRQVTFEIPG